jgi:hypothetical protein
MSFLRYTFLVLVSVCAQCFAQQVAHCPQVIDYAEHKLPHCGVLKMTKTFVYVDLDDAYIHSLIPFIQEEGFQEPPYFGNPYTEGAHISVVYPDEMEKYGIKKIPECGELIYFTPKACKIEHPPKWKGIDEVYFIVVEAPQLEMIRKKYGLPLQNFDFHITIGVKPKKAKAA